MRKKRGYNRDIINPLVRDYKLFAIACEGGKREPEYFQLFEKISNRITIDIIGDIINDEEMNYIHETKSSPKWVLDRAVRYIEKEGLTEEDELWFVMDIDRWQGNQIREIANYCKQKNNWHIALSNPCFEVWLIYHIKEEIDVNESLDCKELKYQLSIIVNSGYNKYRFIQFFNKAINNAQNADTNRSHYFPDPGNTKVYLLAESLIHKIGQGNFENLLENLSEGIKI